MPQAEHLGVPETQVAGEAASTASADELSREVRAASGRHIHWQAPHRDLPADCGTRD